MSDPVTTSAEAAMETAKAVQEVAKLGGKLTDAMNGGGNWLDTVVGGPIRDTVGLLWGDRVRTARVAAAIADEEKLAELLIAARDRLRDKGSKARRELSPKVGLALIEAATVEEASELKAMWAALLASAVDADEEPIEKSFVSILADLAATDALALAQYYAQWPLEPQEKPFYGDGIIYAPALDGDLYGQVVARNLFRLGLIEPATNHFDNYEPPRHDMRYGDYGDTTERVAIPGSLFGVVLTELGEIFCHAVGLKNRCDLARQAACQHDTDNN
jgi:hypothetical protein